MARYSATYSGDTTSFIGGKIASAFGMARAEADAQEKDKQVGLNVANSGNLFIKALGSEFGGDLFARTIGSFNPKSDAKKTDRASSKASRFAANFPRSERKEETEDTVKKSNEEVDRAKDELLRDDDHIPVKDEKLREYVTRVFGVGIDSKLTQLDQRITKSLSVLSDIRATHKGSVDLMIDHNELIAGKLDKILNLYNDQYNFQSVLKDKAQVAKQEQELEKVRDLSRTRRYLGIDYNKGGGAILGGLTDKLVKFLLNKLGLGKFAKKLNQGGPKNLFKFLRRIRSIKPFFGGTERTLVRKIAKANFGDLKKQFPNVSKKVWTRTLKENIKSVSRSGMKPDSIEANIQAAQDAARDIKAEFGEDINPRKATKKGKKPKIKSKKTAQKLARDIGRPFPHVAVPGAPKGLNAARKPLKMSGAGKKLGKKLTTKAGTKAVSKGAKLIPGIGTGIAIGEAAYRAAKGDWTGAGLSLLSAIPVIGWGVTAIDIGRDMGINPLGLPEPPDSFEQGNRPNKYGLTRKGVSFMHGVEDVRAVDPASGMMTSHIQHIGDTLVSTSMKMAKDFGVERDITSKITTLPFALNNIAYSTGIKTSPIKSIATETFIEKQANATQSEWMKKETEKEGGLKDYYKDDRVIDGTGGFNPLDMFADAFRGGRHLLFGGKKSIQFHGEQGPDLSGDPGLDFSFDDFKSNYSLFNGTVIETGVRYGPGYGNVVVIRSTDPSNNREFDALYAHFPDGGIAVKPGQKIRGGQYLGKVGFVSTAIPNVAEMQPNNAGNMSGWHTSVDFFEPDSTTTYQNVESLVSLIWNAKNVSPNGNNILNRLSPDKDENHYAFEKEYIKEMEGTKTEVYPDSKGFPTVGIGHKISADSPSDIRNLQVGDRITEERAHELFEEDWEYHLSMAKKLPGWQSATKRQRAALIDLVYNMGPYFLDNFPSMRRALQKGDFDEAARQLEYSNPDEKPGVRSDWFHDVKERRNQPTLDLMLNRFKDGSYEHLDHLPNIGPLSQGQPNIQVPVSLALLDNLENHNKMYKSLDETTGNLRVVVVNNINNNNQIVRKNSNIYDTGNSLQLFKNAKLVG